MIWSWCNARNPTIWTDLWTLHKKYCVRLIITASKSAMEMNICMNCEFMMHSINTDFSGNDTSVSLLFSIHWNWRVPFILCEPIHVSLITSSAKWKNNRYWDSSYTTNIENHWGLVPSNGFVWLSHVVNAIQRYQNGEIDIYSKRHHLEQNLKHLQQTNVPLTWSRIHIFCCSWDGSCWRGHPYRCA